MEKVQGDGGTPQAPIPKPPVHRLLSLSIPQAVLFAHSRRHPSLYLTTFLAVCLTESPVSIERPENRFALHDLLLLLSCPLRSAFCRAGRTGRLGSAGRKGVVISLVTKRDAVLATAIQRSIETGLDSLTELSSDRKDYKEGGKFFFLSQAGMLPSSLSFSLSFFLFFLSFALTT